MNDRMMNTDRMAKAFLAGALHDAWRYILTIAIGMLLVMGSDSPCSAIQFTRAVKLFEIDQGLTTPSDVAVSDQGRIYIVDGVNHAVKVFSSNGKKLFSFGSQGIGNGQFQHPLGIDIDSSGTVYVADTGNHRIQIFSAQGKYIDKITIEAGGRHPADPTDVAVDESRRQCYAVDNDNHRIAVLDLREAGLVGLLDLIERPRRQRSTAIFACEAGNAGRDHHHENHARAFALSPETAACSSGLTARARRRDPNAQQAENEAAPHKPYTL